MGLEYKNGIPCRKKWMIPLATINFIFFNLLSTRVTAVWTRSLEDNYQKSDMSAVFIRIIISIEMTFDISDTVVHLDPI